MKGLSVVTMVAGDPKAKKPQRVTERFLVKPWKFNAKNNQGNNQLRSDKYPWKNALNGKPLAAQAPSVKAPRGYDFAGQLGVEHEGIDGGNLLAQNNSNPIATSTNHIIDVQN